MTPEAASMGPRSFNRGNLDALQDGMGWSDWLQWGRGLSTAEMSNSVRFSRACWALLQWGRGLSTAEMFDQGVPCHPSLRSFNGAAVFQPRKWDARREHGRYGGSFNGAAVFQPRKSESLMPNLAFRPSLLQWGRGLSTAEIASCGTWPRPARPGFNGAAVFQPWK